MREIADECRAADEVLRAALLASEASIAALEWGEEQAR